jgi:hypothetical protein
MVGRLSESDALAAHKAGRLYTAVAGTSERPFAFLDVRLETESVGVSFLDPLLRVSTSFSFGQTSLNFDGGTKKRPVKRAPPGMMFLQSVVQTEYEGDTDKVSIGTSYNYEFSGRCRMRRRWFATNEVSDLQEHFDVSAHWEPIPEFGAYEGCLVFNRWANATTAH